MSGAYGSDPAIGVFFAMGWALLAGVFGSGPVLQTALQYGILYFPPLQPTFPIPFPPVFVLSFLL